MPSEQLSPEFHSSGWSKGSQLSSKHDMGEHLARMSAQLSSLEAQFVSQDPPAVKYRSTSDAVPAHQPRTSTFSLASSSSVGGTSLNPSYSAASDEEGKKRAAARRTAILQAYAASRSSSPKNNSSSELPPSSRQPPRMKEPLILSPIAASPSTLPPSASHSPESEIRVYQLQRDSSDESDSDISEDEALKALESSGLMRPGGVIQHDDDSEEDSDVPEEVNVSSSHGTPSFSFDATLSGLPSPPIFHTGDEGTFEHQRRSPEVPLAARIALMHQRQAQGKEQPSLKPPDVPRGFNPGVRSLGLDDSVLYGSPVVNLSKKRRAEGEASPLTPTPTPTSLPPRPPSATSASVMFPRAGWTTLMDDKGGDQVKAVKKEAVSESAFSKMIPPALMTELASTHKEASDPSLGHEPTLSIPLAYSPQRYLEREEEEVDHSNDENEASFSLDVGNASFQHDLKKTLIVTGVDMTASMKQVGSSSEGLRNSSEALQAKLRRLKQLRQLQQPAHTFLSPTSQAPHPPPLVEDSKREVSHLKPLNTQRSSSKSAGGSRRDSVGNSPSYSSSRASTPSHTSFSHSSDLLMHEPQQGRMKTPTEGSPAIAAAAAAYARALVGEGRMDAHQSSAIGQEGMFVKSNAGGGGTSALLDVRRSLTSFLDNAINPPSSLAQSPSYGQWTRDSLDKGSVTASQGLSGSSLEWGAVAPSLPPPAYPPPKAKAPPPTFYSYSPPMGEEGVRAASPNLVLTSRRTSSEDRAILIGSFSSSSPTPEPPTSQPAHKPLVNSSPAPAPAPAPPNAASSRAAALLRLKQKRLQSSAQESSQDLSGGQEVNESSSFDLRGSIARSHLPHVSKIHAPEPLEVPGGPEEGEGEGEGAPKQFLKRRSKAVTYVKVDWSHVKPKTITTSRPGEEAHQELRPPSAPRVRSKEPQGPPKPRFGLGPVKDRSLLKGFGDPSPVKPSQYHPPGTSRSGLTSARKAMAARNPAEASKRVSQKQPSVPSSPTHQAKARHSSDLGYEVTRPTSTFHPSGDYTLSPRKENTPSKFNFQLSRGSASASIEGSPLQQLLSHVNSLLHEFDANVKMPSAQHPHRT